MHKPHQNRQNFFSQVGLHEINVIGEGLDLLTEPYTSRVASQNAEYIDEKSIEDEFIYSKLIILQQFKDQAVKEENYD
jgi:centrosomal protein CEP104